VTTASVVTAHINLLCSDRVVRRFYLDPAAHNFRKTGHVTYQGKAVKGRMLEFSDPKVFVEDILVPFIPNHAGWVTPHNCSARVHCDRTRRCIGGCK